MKEEKGKQLREPACSDESQKEAIPDFMAFDEEGQGYLL